MKETVEGTKEQVIKAAAHLIHIQGYNNTSVEDILRESGIGKGSFYYHFKSKEELGFAVLEWHVNRFGTEVLETTCSGTGDPLGRIACFLETIAKRQREENCQGGCAMGNLALEMSDVHVGFRQKLIRVFEAWKERLREILVAAQKIGQIRQDLDPGSLAQFIVANVEGAILLGKVKKDPSVLSECFQHVMSYLREARV